MTAAKFRAGVADRLPFAPAWYAPVITGANLRRLPTSASRPATVAERVLVVLPNGTIIRDALEGWARQTERKLGYQRVVTPHIAQRDVHNAPLGPVQR